MNDSKIILGNHEFTTLIALTEEEQNRGLMGVVWPPPVMCFPKEKPVISKYWMKNTPSPLDIVFCHAGKVIKIEAGVPFSEKRVGPDRPVDLVVELPWGTSERHSIASGTAVRLVYGMEALGRRIELWLAKNS